MFCPKCKAEYREGFSVCADCDVPLVEELPPELEREPEPEPDYVEYELVLSTYNPSEIASIESILEAEDIDYFFQGEGASRLYPIPTRLMVDKRHIDRVNELLANFSSGPEAPPRFSDAELEQVAMAADAPEENDPEGEDKAGQRRSRAALYCLLFFLAIVALVGIVWAWQDYKRRQRPITTTDTADYNKDGKPDAWFRYERGLLIDSAQDNNFDGRVDVITRYRKGVPISGEQDSNYDGRMDVTFHYEHGRLVRSEHDLDFDGIPDATYYYRDEGVDRVDHHPHGSTNIVKRELYSNGLLKKALVDTDGDGVFDQLIKYDKMGNPTRTGDPTPQDLIRSPAKTQKRGKSGGGRIDRK